MSQNKKAGNKNNVREGMKGVCMVGVGLAVLSEDSSAVSQNVKCIYSSKKALPLFCCRNTNVCTKKHIQAL